MIRVRKLKRGESPGSSDRSEQDNLVRFRAHRAEIEGLKLAKMRGELLERKQVGAMVASWVSAFARGLVAVDSRLSHLTDPDELRKQMREEHRRLLDEFARSGQKLNNQDE